jgi:hypothetical protein
MAEEKIEIDILINAADSAKSVKELKQAVKDLESATLQAAESGDTNLARKYGAAAAEAKDKVEDLREEINSMKGAAEKIGAVANVGRTIAGGFAAAQGAAALFGESQAEIEKQLLKVQAATAVLSGVQELSDAGKHLRIAKTIAMQQIEIAQTKLATVAEEGGIVARNAAAAAQWLLNKAMSANPIGVVITAVLALVAAYKLLSDNTEEVTKAQIESNDKMLESNKKRYSNEIEYQKALGKNTTELEIQRETQLINQEKANVRFLLGIKDRSDEQNKALESNVAALEESSQRLRVLTATREKDAADARAKEEEADAAAKQKDLERQQEHNAKLLEEQKKHRAAMLGDTQAMETIRTEDVLKRQEQEIATAEHSAQLRAVEAGNKVLQGNQEQLDRDAWLVMDAERSKKESDIKKLTAQNAINAKIAERNANLQAGTDILNAALTIGNSLIKDTKKLEAFNKKAALLQIGVDSAKAIAGVVSAAASSSITPADMAAKIAVGTATVIANIAKAKKLMDGSNSTPSLGGAGVGGGSNISTNVAQSNITATASARPLASGLANTGATRSGTSPSMPTLNKDCNCPEVGFGGTQLDENGRPIQVVKAFVVESEMTTKQHIIKQQKERATL